MVSAFYGLYFDGLILAHIQEKKIISRHMTDAKTSWFFNLIGIIHYCMLVFEYQPLTSTLVTALWYM